MRLLVCFLCVSALTAADPVTEPAPLNTATKEAAEAAADAYLKQLSTRPDPEVELALADMELLLLEGLAMMDAGQPLKAGEKYLQAIEKRKAIPVEQQPVLGERLRKADAKLLTLSRTLLGDVAFALGEQPTENDQPETPPTSK